MDRRSDEEVMSQTWNRNKMNLFGARLETRQDVKRKTRGRIVTMHANREEKKTTLWLFGLWTLLKLKQKFSKRSLHVSRSRKKGWNHWKSNVLWEERFVVARFSNWIGFETVTEHQSRQSKKIVRSHACLSRGANRWFFFFSSNQCKSCW